MSPYIPQLRPGRNTEHRLIGRGFLGDECSCGAGVHIMQFDQHVQDNDVPTLRDARDSATAETIRLRSMLTRERARYRRRKARDGASLVQRTTDMVLAQQQAAAAEMTLTSVAALADEPCECHTRSTCVDTAGHTPRPQDTAHHYCLPCRLRHALSGATTTTPKTPGRHAR